MSIFISLFPVIGLGILKDKLVNLAAGATYNTADSKSRHFLTTHPRLASLIKFSLGLIFGLCAACILGGLLLYCAARIFIVVESFISLRHVPIGFIKRPISTL
jgi:hypothetical protein